MNQRLPIPGGRTGDRGRGEDNVNFYERGAPFYEFSNFAEYPIHIQGVKYPTSEHYFQSQKYTHRPQLQEAVRCASTPRKAYDMTRQAEFYQNQRADWDACKDDVMKHALIQKFTQHSSRRAMLKDTGSRCIVEHTRKDKYWGDGGDGTGENRLGKLLMEVRDHLA